MKSKKKKYTLQIPARTENLEYIRSFVANIAQKSGFCEDDIYKIELAVDEACSNVIKHAYKNGKKNGIDIEIAVDGKKLTIVITDHGVGFDLNKILKKDMDKYIAEMKPGGLGIHLIRTLMDEVAFESVPGEKTVVKMSKYKVKEERGVRTDE